MYRLSDFNGRSLSVGYASDLDFNPDIERCHALMGWYNSGGRTSEVPSSALDTQRASRNCGRVPHVSNWRCGVYQIIGTDAPFPSCSGNQPRGVGLSEKKAHRD